MKTKLIKFLWFIPILALFVQPVSVWAQSSLDQCNKDHIYNDTVWYDPCSQPTAAGVALTSCASTTSGGGDTSTSGNPYFVLTYPAGLDPNAAGKQIDDWIAKNDPSSPWRQIPNFGVRFATQDQQMNVNPYLITAIGNQETQLGQTGSGRTNNNSFGEKLTDGSGNYRTWPSFEASLFGSGSWTEIYQGNITGKSPYYKDVHNIWEYLSVHLLGHIIYPGNTSTFYDPTSGKTTDISYLQNYYQHMQQWIGEMTGTTINIPPPSGPGQGGTAPASCSCQQAEIATAMSYAWPTYHEAVYLTKTATYAAAIKTAISKGIYTAGSSEPYAGIDCGAFVTVVMVLSGADPNYNSQKGNTTDQQTYLNQHPELYENLGTKTSTVGLEPGDIAINSEHTYIYAGNQGYPGYDSLSASTGPPWRAPMASTSYFTNSAGLFTWYRLKCATAQAAPSTTTPSTSPATKP